MPLRDDYLTRMVEKLAGITARIRSSIAERQFLAGHRQAGDAFQQLLGLNAETVALLSHRDMMKIFGGGGKRDRGRCIVLAELLKLKGDLQRAQGETAQSVSFYRKSLDVFLEILLEDGEMRVEPYPRKVADLVELLGEYELPDSSKAALFRYYETTGEYGKAEDVLFDRLEAGAGMRDVVDEGIAFYRRLLEKAESELRSGNLPPAEIREGLSRLENYSK
ncbi:hypothetical protein EDC14_1003104 [Hydrogenispora ethanolica]|uniref:Tetratricopeptide repeat protein n=1 Tax=Hydrogenispora ethanolica TaxID=1082276 RepID=A0A4R1S711_HYDET|nr:DUF6483 family protein [Hydrogenispora ethanolica]TCL75173.1 hypothetical protein EDC14_1003104 [Hydrogenispora ethanolica]